MKQTKENVSVMKNSNNETRKSEILAVSLVENFKKFAENYDFIGRKTSVNLSEIESFTELSQVYELVKSTNQESSKSNYITLLCAYYDFCSTLPTEQKALFKRAICSGYTLTNHLRGAFSELGTLENVDGVYSLAQFIKIFESVKNYKTVAKRAAKSVAERNEENDHIILKAFPYLADVLGGLNLKVYTKKLEEAKKK